MEQLGNRLRDLREARNLTQLSVAEALHINNRLISNYERNVSLPPVDTLKQLCEFYGVSADYLLQINQKKDSSYDHEKKE